MEKTVENVTNMSDQQFIEFAESLTSTKQKDYGITSFADAEGSVFADSISEEVSIQGRDTNKSQSWFGLWCNTWCCPNDKKKRNPSDDYSDRTDNQLTLTSGSYK
jgi:hypothetical protein